METFQFIDQPIKVSNDDDFQLLKEKGVPEGFIDYDSSYNVPRIKNVNLKQDSWLGPVAEIEYEEQVVETSPDNTPSNNDSVGNIQSDNVQSSAEEVAREEQIPSEQSSDSDSVVLESQKSIAEEVTREEQIPLEQSSDSDSVVLESQKSIAKVDGIEDFYSLMEKTGGLPEGMTIEVDGITDKVNLINLGVPANSIIVRGMSGDEERVYVSGSENEMPITIDDIPKPKENYDTEDTKDICNILKSYSGILKELRNQYDIDIKFENLISKNYTAPKLTFNADSLNIRNTLNQYIDMLDNIISDLEKKEMEIEETGEGDSGVMGDDVSVIQNTTFSSSSGKHHSSSSGNLSVKENLTENITGSTILAVSTVGTVLFTEIVPFFDKIQGGRIEQANLEGSYGLLGIYKYINENGDIEKVYLKILDKNTNKIYFVEQNSTIKINLNENYQNGLLEVQEDTMMLTTPEVGENNLAKIADSNEFYFVEEEVSGDINYFKVLDSIDGKSYYIPSSSTNNKINFSDLGLNVVESESYG